MSSISGSEDEAETRPPSFHFDAQKGIDKKKLFFRLQSGDKVSIWKCLIMDDAESVSFENDRGVSVDCCGSLVENEVTERLRNLIRENKDDRQMRVVLLASGGHFAGTVFNGKSVVAHKTFHRYFSSHFLSVHKTLFTVLCLFLSSNSLSLCVDML